ncbi:AsnC family transcriptional regulator, partial [Vibrio parahaemolyticus]|nr:AsnC family transcriptional regulator [Vibrio parahaemolyticus]
MIEYQQKKGGYTVAHEYRIPNLTLDERDKQILSLLHEDGRMSYTDLGKQVGLSRV